MSRLSSWLLLLALFGAFGVVVALALQEYAAAGKGMPEFSIYSEERNGLAETARFLRKLGWEPVAVTRPIQQVAPPDGTPRLLLLVEPEGTAFLPGEAPDLSDVETQGLLRWVAQGNTLLLCCRRTTALHRALNVVVSHDERYGEEILTPASPEEAGSYTEGIDRLAVEGRDVLSGNVGLPLWWLGDEPGALVVRRGKGRVLLVADPSLVTLRGLRRDDNVLFLARVISLHARDGRVYFDEYHHGLRSGGGFWGYLSYHDQHGTALLVLPVLAVAGWSLAVRLGRAVPLPQESQADAVDYASAVARIYQRAGVVHLLAETLCRDILTVLTRHARLRRTAPFAEILAVWRRQHGDDTAREVEALLRGVAVLRKSTVSERQLASWVKTFDRFQTEVLRAS
jgi:hypothetical protein